MALRSEEATGMTNPQNKIPIQSNNCYSGSLPEAQEEHMVGTSVRSPGGGEYEFSAY